MGTAYIVDALRTAGGRRKGRLSGVHANILGATVLDALLARTDVDPSAIEDVILGCVTQAGEQSLNVARNIVLASNLPTSVPAVSIDRQCGSSQQAVQFAAQAIMSGTQDLVIAAGVESMTRVPMGSAVLAESGVKPRPDSLLERFGVKTFSQFEGAVVGCGVRILIVVGVALDLVDKVEAQLLVRHYEGFTLKEIAEIRGCALGTGKSTLHQAFRSLRKTLGADTLARVGKVA